MQRARPAAAWWHELGFDGRKRRLRAWRCVIASRIDEFAELIHRENGKPIFDAVGEISIAVEHLDWAAGAAAKTLGRRRVGSGLLAMNHAASIEYLPYGVVGVIGPWNYPVHTPMGSISYALAAGNAVVFKPSEFTPAIGAWLVDTFAEVVPEQPVLSLVTGFGATGNALCRAGVDKLAFTGSTATGKKVMAACADLLTPVVIECGGKDALIVATDADLDAAAEATVWGGLSNAGQTCAGVERVYAVAAVYDEFVAKVVARAQRVRGGPEDAADYGPITMPGQLDVIRRTHRRRPRQRWRAPWSAAQTRCSRRSCSRWCSSTCPSHPPPCARRRSARLSRWRRSATRTRRSRVPTTAATASVRRCSARRTVARSPSSCRRAA